MSFEIFTSDVAQWPGFVGLIGAAIIGILLIGTIVLFGWSHKKESHIV